MNVTPRQWIIVIALALLLWIGISAVAYGLLKLAGAVS